MFLIGPNLADILMLVRKWTFLRVHFTKCDGSTLHILQISNHFGRLEMKPSIWHASPSKSFPGPNLCVETVFRSSNKQKTLKNTSFGAGVDCWNESWWVSQVGVWKGTTASREGKTAQRACFRATSSSFHKLYLHRSFLPVKLWFVFLSKTIF